MSGYQSNARNFDPQTLPILKNTFRILKSWRARAVASNHTLWGWAWKAEE
jgi:hypothetical protein